jgi:hypothetical protein
MVRVGEEDKSATRGSRADEGVRPTEKHGRAAPGWTD